MKPRDEPWLDEPDRIDMTRKGFDLAIRRNPELGNLCGYIRVPDWHPLYGEEVYDREDVPPIHGGWTYCGPECPGDDGASGWWIGFDCAHGMDLVPRIYRASMRPDLQGTYRDVAFVTAELEAAAAFFYERASNHRKLELTRDAA